MDAASQAIAVRSGAGLFRRVPRAVIEVTGADRERWLAGMVSADVTALAAGPQRSGCYATLLTPQGRLISDLQVVLRPEAWWLDVPAAAADAVMERLERYIIADDVSLRNLAPELARLAVEGPAAMALLARAGAATPELAQDACADATLAGHRVVLGAFGWSGEPGRQLFVPAAAADAVAAALLAGAGDLPLVEAGEAALEILRIEAGVPFAGSELDESVLPAEAGLERALTNPRCYTGQEVVERLRSQGRASHRLVGIAAAGTDPPAAGAALHAGEKRVGEVTSSCLSPHAGAIGLAYVRRAHAEPGTELVAAELSVRVAALPFVTPAAPTQ